MDYEEHLVISGDKLVIKPVEREKPIYGKATMEIKLDHNMVDIAKSCGISNDEYASQYLKMKLKDLSRVSEMLDMNDIRSLRYDRT